MGAEGTAPRWGRSRVSTRGDRVRRRVVINDEVVVEDKRGHSRPICRKRGVRGVNSLGQWPASTKKTWSSILSPAKFVVRRGTGWLYKSIPKCFLESVRNILIYNYCCFTGKPINHHYIIINNSLYGHLLCLYNNCFSFFSFFFGKTTCQIRA